VWETCCAMAVQRLCKGYVKGGLCTERLCTDGAVFKQGCARYVKMLCWYVGVLVSTYQDKTPQPITVLLSNQLPALKGPLPEYPTTSAARQGVHFTDT
jgi:hypothetical protein